MKKVILLGCALGLAACHDGTVSAPSNTPPASAPTRGGPCGDGAVLAPNEKCK